MEKYNEKRSGTQQKVVKDKNIMGAEFIHYN